MQVLQLDRAVIICLALSLFAVICCYDKDDTLEVVGFIKHSDFTKSKMKTSQSLSGFHVTIGCRSEDGKMKTMGSSEVNDEEKFNVYLPQETAKNGVIRQECYAQLHSASDSPCPLHHSQEALNIIFQYKTKDTNVISHSEKLIFSPITCTSKFLWPFHKPKWPSIVQTPFVYPPPSENSVPPSVSTPVAAPIYNYPHSPSLNSKQPFLPKLGDLSPSPAPTFDTPTSPLPNEPLQLVPSPSPLAYNTPFPLPHVPSFTITQPPPFPSYNRPSPSPAS